MKIAQVCPYDYQALGGVQSHIRELSRALRERGHEVSVIAPYGSRPHDKEVITAGRFRRIRFSQTAFEITWMSQAERSRLKETLARQQFDLLHFHTVWTPAMPVQLLLDSKLPKVATFHDTAPDTLLGKILSRTLMPLASAALCGFLLDRSIAVSESPLRHMQRLYKGPIQVVPNGVRFQDYAANPALPEYDDGKLNILYLGRLEERKGVFYLLEAFHTLQCQFDNLRLLLAGDGHLHDRIVQEIDRRGLRRVELLGRVDETQKRRLFASCDIYCSPAVGGESFGIVLLEAMASGKPAVGAANSGYRCVLKGQGAELLVPPRDSESLAGLLAKLIQDPALRRRLGQWGRLEAQRYDWSEVAQEVEKIYLSMVPG